MMNLAVKEKTEFWNFFFAFKNYESVCYPILKNIFGSSNLTSGKFHLLKKIQMNPGQYQPIPIE